MVGSVSGDWINCPTAISRQLGDLGASDAGVQGLGVGVSGSGFFSLVNNTPPPPKNRNTEALKATGIGPDLRLCCISLECSIPQCSYCFRCDATVKGGIRICVFSYV